MACVILMSTAYAQTNHQEIKALNTKINALAEQLEELKNQGTSNQGVKFGGYGEIIYNKTEAGEGDTVGGDPTFDNVRFILYAGYDFSPKWSLVSEIEIEHADEIYMEQAYLQYLHNGIAYRFGTLLVPVGHQNLWHESTAFFGNQRTQTEKRIIPSTWRENGIEVYGKMDKSEWYVTIVNGLDGSAIDSSGVRGGRQKASKANASGYGVALRYDYKLTPSSELGVSHYQGEFSNIDADHTHTISDIHYKGQFNALYTRFLYVHSTINGADDISAEISQTIADVMNSYYVELGYDINHGTGKWGVIPFIRHEVINTQAEVDDSLTENKEQDQTHQTFGVVVKPLKNIVLKADYTKTKNEAETGQDSWNVGVGWNF